MKIAYRPEKLKIEVKPKLFAAGSKCLVVVDENNQVIKFIYFQCHVTNDFVPGGLNDKMKVETGIGKVDGTAVFGGEIVGIGG